MEWIIAGTSLVVFVTVIIIVIVFHARRPKTRLRNAVNVMQGLVHFRTKYFDFGSPYLQMQ